MQEFSNDQVREVFRNGGDFNELFEAFRVAIERKLGDLDTYRELFWNIALKPEELLFFAKKLAEVFPELGFDTYSWLSKVFEARFENVESIELSFLCLRKASEFNRKSLDLYLNACKLYDQDLKIPALQSILEFLKEGVGHVEEPRPLYEQLAIFYSMLGNDEMFFYFNQKANPSS